MDKVQKLSNAECYTTSPEPCRIDNKFVIHSVFSLIYCCIIMLGCSEGVSHTEFICSIDVVIMFNE
jgi:hypothetical protein